MKIIPNVRATVYISDLSLRVGENPVLIEPGRVVSSINLLDAVAQGLVKIEVTDNEKNVPGLTEFLEKVDEVTAKSLGIILSEKITEDIRKKRVTSDSPVRPVLFLKV